MMLIKIAEFVERDAGHICTALFTILMAAGLWAIGLPKAEDLILVAIGWMGRSMMGKNGVK
jgi:hypothetical protein